MSAFAVATGAGECRQMPGVLIASAGIDCAVFNAALLTPPAVANPNEFERRLLSAAVHYRTRGLPWSFWLCESTVEEHARREADGILQRCGLANISVSPGMVADRLAPAGVRAPALEFRSTTGAEARTAFCYVMAAAFALPFETARLIYGTERIWRSGCQGWVGYVKEEAVTTAAVIPDGDVLGVYAVATLAAFRRRGYAEAVTRYALEQARRATGVERSVLQSTKAGLELYRKMGYRETTRVAVFQSR
jgi:ribosomal protein S18 acetylase RimI-like enzyme